MSRAGTARPGRPGVASLPPPPAVKPSADALAIFFRSLAAMQRAGVGLGRCFKLLSEQSDDKAMGLIAKDLGLRIDSGVSLSAAFGTHKQAFSVLQVRMLQIGERTGNIAEVVHELAEHEEKRRNIELKVRSSLAYPCFIAVAAMVMVMILPPFMLGGLFKMIENSAVKPPLLTTMVVGFSHLMQNPVSWIAFALLGFAAVSGWKAIHRNPSTALSFSEKLLTVPVLGRVYRLVGLTRFSRALAVQLEVGESPLSALKLAAEASENPYLVHRIPEALEELKNGNTIVGSLEVTAFFPKGFLHMLRAGEETAQTAEITERLSAMYETELECALETFTSLLEPLVMLGMGIVVGIIVVATMLPMLQLLQTM